MKGCFKSYQVSIDGGISTTHLFVSDLNHGMESHISKFDDNTKTCVILEAVAVEV